VCRTRTRTCRATSATVRMRVTEDSTIRGQLVRAGLRTSRATTAFSVRARGGRAVGRVLARKLRPGRYRLRLVATDAAGKRSRTVIRTLVVR